MTSNLCAVRRPAGGACPASDYQQVEPVILGEAPTCAGCGRYTSVRPWLPPHFVLLEQWGEGWADVAFGTSLELLVSERLLRVVRTAGLDGFADASVVTITRPIRVVRANAARPRYFAVRPPQHRLEIDFARSGIRWARGRICPECGLGDGPWTAHGIVCQATGTKMPGLCYPVGLPGVCVASPDFVELARVHALSGFDLTPLSDLVRG